MRKIKSYFNASLLKHILFWICVFLYFMLTANFNFYSSYQQVIEFSLMVVLTQMLTAYTCLYLLIPKTLNKRKYVLFAVSLFVLLFVMFAIYNLYKFWFYDPKYYETYNELGKLYAKESFLERLAYPSVFLSKCIKFLTPTALLLMAGFYKNQQQFLQLKEQKKTAELLALKNQLNPHFLFNTLNNLYSLAIEKSDKTPEVIERLSDILDYILYRCKDQYVPLLKEVELIENYLALEKVRYGKRVNIVFNKVINEDINIAPLILLTFIENAFKHGVKQALHQAQISICLKTEEDRVVFEIENSKPNTKLESEEEPLGLKNLKKQLELLYPESHSLTILNENDRYSVTLKLNSDPKRAVRPRN